MADEVTDRQARSEDIVESVEEWVIALRRMEHLESRERDILTLRYGMEGERLTFNEIGRRFGMTREWVRKLELRALRKLSGDRCEQAFGWRVANQSHICRRGEHAGRTRNEPARSHLRNGNSVDPAHS